MANTLIASPNDTVVYAGSTAAITDAAGHRWTIASSGVALVDGKAAGFTANVAEIAYINGTVWHENTASQWYAWNASAWTVGSNPLPGAPQPPTPTPSPNDTVVYAGSTAAITDAAGHRWTIASSGVALVDGKAAGFTANVAEIAYINGTVWHENTASQWYAWNASAWTVGSNPLPGAPQPPTPTPSPNDTVVYAGSTAAITDAAGHRWTIASSGVALVDGKAAGFTANVAEIAYINGTVWHENTASQWYAWNASAWTVGSNPLPGAPQPPTPTPSPNDTVVYAGSTAAITDAAGHRWTIASSGVALVDGKAAGFTANVAEIAYINGTVWHENTASQWYAWNASAWTVGSNPLPGAPQPPTPTPSPNDTVVYAGSTAAITDAAGHRWTIASSGVALVDGKAAGFTANVAEIAYINGTVWHENTASQWYAWNASAWTVGSNPLPGAPQPPTPTPSPNDTVVYAGSTAAITDAAGHRWTIASSGVALVDGKAAGFTANVAEIAYINGTVWHENTASQWYAWNASAWTVGSNPLPGTDVTLNLNGYHLTFDWEANDFPNNSTPKSGAFATTLSDGLRYLSNGDQQYWADSSTGQNPFNLNSGVLDISATNVGAGNTPGGGSLSYVSGVVTTQGSFSQQYGYFEMRAELPSGVGMWPAFWLLDNNSNQPGGWPPELDVLETFGAPNANGEGGTNQAHWDVHSQNASQEAGAWVSLVGNESTEFHTYGVLWTPTKMSFVYDDKITAEAPTPSDYTQEMYMIINLAVGGTWPGYATGENGTMKIDYLRAFSSDSAIPAVALQSISSPDGSGTSLYGASSSPVGAASSNFTTPQMPAMTTILAQH